MDFLEIGKQHGLYTRINMRATRNAKKREVPAE
jgi:hypothetical protein